MTAHLVADLYTTHDVTNQPPALDAYNAYEQDTVLVEAVHREGAGWVEEKARQLGGLVGSERMLTLARRANAYSPVLRTHDRFGNRIDLVDFDPAYHELMALAFGAEVHSLAWTAHRPGAHTARAVLSYLWNLGENGIGCPTAMAYAAVPALRHQPDIAAEWEPKILANEYDPRLVPIKEKNAATIGMAMTEKQGGSDLRANTTRAEAIGAGGPGGEYSLTGHKWFCSAPMSDGFLTLAHTGKPGLLSCFIVPRRLPDGTPNRFFIQRLKDKLGNRSNASSEIEYHQTWAQMVGEEGRGIATILEMVHLTRIDFAISSAAIMRQALTQALHHTNYRQAFQRLLVKHPLMRNVLADLALEAEAATVLTLRLARAFDESEKDESQRLLSRLGTPVAKYWICKRTPVFVAEALECLGGNGFVEEGVLPRLYREAPLNGIWEGTGNVICLDVLRAMVRDPRTMPAFMAQIDNVRGADRRLDAFVNVLARQLADHNDVEGRARQVTEMMALALQGALLIQHSPPAVADAFCASRLAGDWGRAFGTLPSRLAYDDIIKRARVEPR
jgi:putative acyl-CoA dehydrogenase